MIWMNTKRMQRWSSTLLLVALLLAMAGCATAPEDQRAVTPLATTEQTAVPSPTQNVYAVAYAVGGMKPMGFASVQVEPVTVQPSVPPYNPDPQAARNPDLLGRLTPAQVEFLAQHGFVILPQGPQQIYQVYKQAADADTPVFVTTDALMHTYHILYDYTLRHVEVQYLTHDLEQLLAALIAATEEQLQEARDLEPVREAASRNLAYLVVAASLLNPDTRVPDEVGEMVRQELALIEAHAGLSASPILGYWEDYTQYVPRGHYTRNETLQRYFRSMMWLGRIMFRLQPGEADADLAAGRRETRQALLLVAALHNARAEDADALTLWDRIYAPTTFFVGRSDDLNVYDYSEVVGQVWGDQLDLALLADDEQVDTFIQAAASLRSPQVVSSFVTDQHDVVQVTKGFRLMGQRFVPDSYILQQLVYNRVLEYQEQGKPFTMEMSDAGPIRAFPRGLDVAAVLGSQRALDILTEEGDTAYVGYAEQMAKLQHEFADLPANQWQENLYWNWLHTLRPLLAPKGAGYPAFMQGLAWADKNLNSFLGSWAELRHDTLLYAKQSYTVKATSMRPEVAKLPGYVEPEVEVWSRLLYLVRQTRTGLTERGLLNDEFQTKLSNMERLVSDLRDISEAELSNQPLDEQQVALIERIGSMLEGLTTFSQQTEDELTSEADERMAVVADVHTDVHIGQVLEEGVGDPFTLFVLTPDGRGGTVLTVGGVFSHYEFKQPMSQRLTDEAWQQMEPKPSLAPWFDALVQE